MTKKISENNTTQNIETNTELILPSQDTAIVPFGITEQHLAAITANMPYVTPQDFGVIKIPSGGSTFFTVATLEGDQPVAELSGPILAIKKTRAFWPKKLDAGGGNENPACSSADSIIGEWTPEEFEKLDIQEPSGICRDCVYSKYSPAMESTPCKEFWYLYMLFDGDCVPTALRLSRMSIIEFRGYMAALMKRGIPFAGCVTGFTLRATLNKGGLKYSVVVPKAKRRLSPEETTVISKLAEKFDGLINQHIKTIDITPEQEEKVVNIGSPNVAPPVEF